jgi:glycosyltransferase involved in cell wall biosynthesis
MFRVIHLTKITRQAGSEGHLLELLQGMRACNVDAHLWLLVEPGNPVQSYVDRAEALGIPVRRFVINRHLDPGLWLRLAKALRQAKPNLVHTHLIHADLYGILAAHLAGVPFTVSSRHNDDKFRRKLPIRLALRALWWQTNAGIAISEAIRQFSIEVEGANPDHIHTIHYGLDPQTVQAPAGARAELCELLRLSADAMIVGSVCRLIEQKGLIYAIRGFAKIVVQVPEAHYVLVGDGLLRPELEAEVEALGMSKKIHFLGWRDDARSIMSALDVLLAPSLWEGFGLVFLEAMALSVPIISTRASAIPEVIIDGETGWLVPPQDADAVAAALLDALTHPAELRERGARGYARLESDFTPQKMVERTLDVYRSLGAKI